MRKSIPTNYNLKFHKICLIHDDKLFALARPLKRAILREQSFLKLFSGYVWMLKALNRT